MTSHQMAECAPLQNAHFGSFNLGWLLVPVWKDAVAIGKWSWTKDVGLHNPASRTRISHAMESLSWSMVHSRWLCCLAKFLRVSVGSFPSTIGTSSAPYDSVAHPSANNPRTWFSIASQNSLKLLNSLLGLGKFISACMWALTILWGCPNLSLKRVTDWW